MTRDELNNIANQIQKTKQPVPITKRELILSDVKNALQEILHTLIHGLINII